MIRSDHLRLRTKSEPALNAKAKDRKRRRVAHSKLQNPPRRTDNLPAQQSQHPEGNLGASGIPPDDSGLREFVADFHAAMSMMRILRQEISVSLSLTSAEYSVLLAVWYLEREKDLTVRAIADHLHVAAPYVTSEIARLVRKGLLAKVPHRIDRRAVGVSLTKGSRELLSRLEPMLRSINRPLFAGLSIRDLTTVHRFLRGIIEHGHEAIRCAQVFRQDPSLPTEASKSDRTRRRRLPQ